MPIDLQLSDDDLKGFSQEARTHLKGALSEYATDLIEEANRIEAGRNSAGGVPEVTRGMVNDAKTLMRQGGGVPRTGNWVKTLRVAAAVLSLVVGIMYDTTLLQSRAYMGLFVVVVTLAILAVTISTMKE